MLWAFQKTIFEFFESFCRRKLKLFWKKLTQSIKNYLTHSFFMGSFLENGFKVTLRSKTNILSIWKDHFSFLCKFLSDEDETTFRESVQKRSNLFKSKFGHRKLLIKMFWTYLELKNKCSEHLKRPVFNFLQVFLWRSWNHLLGESEKVSKTI